MERENREGRTGGVEGRATRIRGGTEVDIVETVIEV